MARLPRLEVPGMPHHVIQRGTNRCEIFRDDQDRRFFLNCFADACDRYHCDVHAYVLMGNHFHFLMTPQAEMGLSRTMQSVGSRYVPYFNRRHARVGALWQGRPRISPVDSEGYFLVCSRYLEMNPVRAGLVALPGSYPWSSFGHHALGHTDPLIRDHSIYLSLGPTAAERGVAYLALFEGALSADTIIRIREATNNGWAVGSKEFCERIESLTGRRPAPISRGGSRFRQSVDFNSV
jgi:putative transposase